MSQSDDSARSYNHLHTARKYTAGKRRFSVYWPGAILGRPIGIRPSWTIASTMTEVRG
jgi:hypothetical protein